MSYLMNRGNDDDWKSKLSRIENSLGAQLLKVEYDAIECPILWVKKDFIINVLSTLRDSEDLDFVFLADYTAYDEKGSPEEGLSRFVLVYNLYSPKFNRRLRVKVRLQENEDPPTVTSLWKGANWAEREIFDMFGIKFSGHPDLRRILMDQRWEGHPLRKDYPLRKQQIFNEPEKIPMELLQKD